MAGMAFTYDVLENGPREFIFTAVGIDTTTTVAFTSESTITGIIAAAVSAASTTYTPSVHNKVRRILYNTTNCFLRLQWHQTTNAELLALGGSAVWGDWNSKDCQGITNPNGTGSTGDIDLTVIPVAAVTSGASVVTAAASLEIYLIKGVQS